MAITLYAFDPLPLSIANNCVHTLNKNNSSTLNLVECLKSNLMCEHKFKKINNHRVVNVKLGLATISYWVISSQGLSM